MAPVGLAVDWIYMAKAGLAVDWIYMAKVGLAVNWIYMAKVGLAVDQISDSSWFTCGTGSTLLQLVYLGIVSAWLQLLYLELDLPSSS